MGLKAQSELMAWALMSLMELCVIFCLISAVLYSGGILAFTNWFFMMFYCMSFGVCLISFWWVTTFSIYTVLLTNIHYFCQLYVLQLLQLGQYWCRG